MTRTLVRVMFVTAGCAAALTSATDARQRDVPALPSRLDSYVTSIIKPTALQRQRLMAGEPLTRMLEADESKEVAVFGLVWVNAAPRSYIDALNDIENFERGAAFRVTRKISAPPRPADFDQLTLSDEDVNDLRRCRVGDCQFKLGAAAIERIRAEVNWSAPDARTAATRLARTVAFDYVTQYLKGGDAELAIYRDTARPTFVAQEFRSMIDRVPELTTYLPEVRQYLLEFPRSQLPGAESFLYWQEANFGLKPTVRINHVVVADNADGIVVASKMLYASHYFWTGLELRVLAPARGGFWFATVNRSRSDGLSGFTGAVVRRRVRSEVERGALTGLRTLKQSLETVH